MTTIEHKFLQYGLFVAAGVGKDFSHGNGGDLLFMGDSYRKGKREYESRQVGAGLSEEHMKSPKFEHVIVKRGKNAGKEAALTSGNKRMPRDWFFKKYYYSIRRLNLRETEFYGRAYQDLCRRSSTISSLAVSVPIASRYFYRWDIRTNFAENKKKMAGIDALRTLFEIIRDEKRTHANTAERIGNALTGNTAIPW